MTHPSAVPEVTPIDYPTASTAGTLIVRREGDTLHVVQPPSTRRTWQMIWPSLLNLWLGVTAAVFWWFWPQRKHEMLPVAGILAVVLLPLGLFAVLECWVVSRFAAELIVTGGKLIIVARQLRNVSRTEYDARHILEVRVDRLRLKTAILPRRYVVLRLSDRQDLAIHQGSEEERVALVELLRDALKLPADPLHRKSYRPKPRWSRLVLTHWPNGVWIGIRPKRISWIATLLLTPMIATTVWWFIIYQATGEMTLRFDPPAKVEQFIFGLTALLTAGLIAGINAVLYRMRRTSVLAVVGDRVELVETGYLSPINHTWPIDRLAGVSDVGRRVMLRFHGEEPVMIRQRLSRRERAWIVATIESARQLPQS